MGHLVEFTNYSRFVEVPTLSDVHQARSHIAPHLRPTPLYQYASLNELIGTEVFVTIATLVGFGLILVGSVLATARNREIPAAARQRAQDVDSSCLSNPVPEP